MISSWFECEPEYFVCAYYCVCDWGSRGHVVAPRYCTFSYPCSSSSVKRRVSVSIHLHKLTAVHGSTTSVIVIICFRWLLHLSPNTKGMAETRSRLFLCICACTFYFWPWKAVCISVMHCKLTFEYLFSWHFRHFSIISVNDYMGV